MYAGQTRALTLLLASFDRICFERQVPPTASPTRVNPAPVIPSLCFDAPFLPLSPSRADVCTLHRRDQHGFDNQKSMFPLSIKPDANRGSSQLWFFWESCQYSHSLWEHGN